jgi:DNA-binding LacI/PurR family transcriptional regulator
LRLLVKRGRLERKQRKGTFVKEPELNSAGPVLRRVHLLVHRNYLKTEGLLADGMVVGIQGELGSAELQFNFMPGSGDEDYVQSLLEEASRSHHKEGFVLVRSSLAVQRLVAQSGLPAVVAGMLYASVPAMPWIDSDNRAAGRLLGERVLRAGHRSVLVLVRDRVLAGDYPFIDGVRDALSQAGAAAEAMIMRHLPVDPEMIREEVRRVLLQIEPLPGIVARSEPLADGAAEAVEAMGLEVGSDVTIALSDWYRRHGSTFPRYPFVRDTITAEDRGRRIARLLARQAVGRGTAAEHEIIPVTFEEPRAPRASRSQV